MIEQGLYRDVKRLGSRFRVQGYVIQASKGLRALYDLGTALLMNSWIIFTIWTVNGWRHDTKYDSYQQWRLKWKRTWKKTWKLGLWGTYRVLVLGLLASDSQRIRE